MKYKITKKDFDTAFDFALRYHLEPKKSLSSRTSGASRGLGGVLDSFILGKLVELGVVKVLKSFNPSKDYILDFDIKQNNEVLSEPDIIGVVENKKERKPKCFLEIKNISKDDRWIGLTLEQFDTIKKSSDPKNIFIIGAYIQNNSQGNFKQKDPLGIYLKDKFKSKIFKSFTSIDNIEIVIEYVISGKELNERGFVFKKGFFIYETEIFEIVGKQVDNNISNGKFKKIGSFSDGILKRYVMDSKFPDPKFIGDIKFNGKIDLYEKLNQKSSRRFIHCLTDVDVSNDMLGIFNLKKGKTYLFNLHTVGRNPALNRNNIWIAKRSIPFLQAKKLITKTEKNLTHIAKEI
ncbi:MAG: hypothetical protein NTW73_01205 [Candidatus Parcubacteria bacterium]|nr:hypothetical protein [Candidatus Parcubacteria bacterium]